MRKKFPSYLNAGVLLLLFIATAIIPAYQHREFLVASLVGFPITEKRMEEEVGVSGVIPGRAPTPHTIELYADGFQPREVTIARGDTVTFVNKRGKPFWPASNIHPTHAIYPEFDPRRPLLATETWSFTFGETGAWRYHDHFTPALGGTIFVTESGPGRVTRPNCRDLRTLGSREKEQCYDELLSEALSQEGVKSAFESLKFLYQTEPQFVTGGCHQYTHKIGDKIYTKYLDQIRKREFDQLELPPETIYCGYGFYHGILEHSFRDNPDIALGKELCEYLDQTYAAVAPRLRLNCYHSLGHGSIREPEDPKLWGNAQAIVDPAFRVCDTISLNPREIRECLQGAFNVISDWIWRSEFGLRPNREDPLKFCREQKTREHSLSCYYEMAMHLGTLVGDDLSRLAKFAEAIDDDEAAGWIIHVAAAAVMERAVIEDDHTRFIYECRRLRERLQGECIEGIAGGFIGHGEPEKEYVKALKFCGSPHMADGEKAVCYKNVINAFRGIYPKGKFDQICRLVEERYRSYCGDAFSPSAPRPQ